MGDLLINPNDGFNILWQDENGAIHRIPCDKNTCLRDVVEKLGVNATARLCLEVLGVSYEILDKDFASVEGQCIGCELRRG